MCNERSGRRACPALGRKICPVCCGTKRQVEIRCPADCVHLVSAQAHPAAVVRRQQEDDLRMFIPTVRDLNARQEELMSRLLMFLREYRGDVLLRLTDDDVEGASAALASTFETASRGLIYEARPSSLPAQRLAADLRDVLAGLTKDAPSSVQADLAVVFHAIARGAREARKTLPGGITAYLELLKRLIVPATPEQAPAPTPETSLLLRP